MRIKRKGAVARFFVQQPLFTSGVFNEPLARGKRNKAKRKEQLGESAAALFSLNWRGAVFPSPYGDMVLKLYVEFCLLVLKEEFPSPYGDMVLKL